MQINWLILAGVAVVLLVPVSWLYPSVAKERLAVSHNARFRLERMFGSWQHWFDLVRAFGATFLLWHFAVEVDLAGADKSDRYYELVLVGGLLALAVVVQTVHYRKFFYFTAPVFFVWGVTLAVMDWVPALFAIVFSAIIARLADHVELKLPLMAGLVGVAGYLADGFSLNLLLIGGLIILPVLIAFGSMHHLVCYTPDLAEE